MKVLFAASEMAPFVKTGGLGDVIGSLPVALREAGIDARVVIPHYSAIREVDYRLTYAVPRRSGDGAVTVHQTDYRGVPVYFLRSWPYFQDDGKIYTVWDWDTPRFIYFSQMVMAFIWELQRGALDDGAGWWPDLVHCHDWHTGLIPFLLHEARFGDGWNRIASLMTIHNMRFQGPYASSWLYAEGIRNRDDSILDQQDWRDNLLAIGMGYANKVNTVSPYHAAELHYPRFGEGLQDLIWRRHADFSGILNGIDAHIYNPAADPHLESVYDAETFRKKRPPNKAWLQSQLDLPVDPNVPLIALIGRITDQKGIDFAVPAIRAILEAEDVQFVGLGTGEPDLQAAFGQIGLDYSWKARTYLMFNEPFAKQIYAGADLLLVPSRYEPCGLTQMIAQRYGCLPLVRETGGLVDTVENYDNTPTAAQGTGFRFLFEEPAALASTIRWALDTFHNRPLAWATMQERGMRKDWSWAPGVAEYRALYRAAIDARRWWEAPGMAPLP
ncbi:MAG: glycogen synthase [Anaerolineae bacterium]|nr:glycogen synthase [Anaerolineae bacterium]